MLLGGLFLLETLGLLRLPGTWGSLVLLVPALVLVRTAVTRSRAAGGRLTAEARGALTGAVCLGVVVLLVLLDLDWGRWWPILVVLAGSAALLNWVVETGCLRRR